jgi:cytochrome c oxidase assembly factor CtaG
LEGEKRGTDKRFVFYIAMLGIFFRDRGFFSMSQGTFSMEKIFFIGFLCQPLPQARHWLRATFYP